MFVVVVIDLVVVVAAAAAVVVDFDLKGVRKDILRSVFSIRVEYSRLI